MRKKTENPQLAIDIGKRIKKVIGDTAHNKYANEIGIKPHTLWGYINGRTFPGIEVLIKIAKLSNVSIDWLLKGEESQIPKDEKEKQFLKYYREAEELGIVDKVEHFARYTIDDAKREKAAKTTAKAA